MTTVLICDDSVAVHESLRVYLEESGIHVLSAYTGEDAVQMLRTQSVQLLILDLMLPGRLGTEILREIRQFSSVPVLILSAKDSEFDRILGLELGADDYVVKPFSPREVAARVRTILKRTGRTPEHRVLSFASLTVDQDAYSAKVGTQLLNLTAKELEVLALFAAHPDTALSRERIMNAVWGYQYCNDTRAVDTQIMRLRQKLPKDADFEITSIYGVGYKLVRK